MTKFNQSQQRVSDFCDTYLHLAYVSINMDFSFPQLLAFRSVSSRLSHNEGKPHLGFPKLEHRAERVGQKRN